MPDLLGLAYRDGYRRGRGYRLFPRAQLEIWATAHRHGARGLPRGEVRAFRLGLARGLRAAVGDALARGNA